MSHSLDPGLSRNNGEADATVGRLQSSFNVVNDPKLFRAEGRRQSVDYSESAQSNEQHEVKVSEPRGVCGASDALASFGAGDSSIAMMVMIMKQTMIVMVGESSPSPCYLTPPFLFLLSFPKWPTALALCRKVKPR